MMKITGVLVNMLVELNPELYGPYVVYKKNGKVLYVQVIRAIYGMLEAALLWYKKFRKELEAAGFKFNPYDPFVANRQEKGSQHTLLFHVDDLKSSHTDSRVNDELNKLLQENYGEHGGLTIHRGKTHDYLGMQLNYSVKGKVKVGMIKYVSEMFKHFPQTFKENEVATTPAYSMRDKGGNYTKKCGYVPHNGGKSPIPMQSCKTRHTADDCCAMHKGQGTQRS
jgi:hypothetical protein